MTINFESISKGTIYPYPTKKFHYCTVTVPKSNPWDNPDVLLVLFTSIWWQFEYFCFLTIPRKESNNNKMGK